MNDTTKEWLDWSALLGTLAYLAEYFWGVLPHLTALVTGLASMVWTILRVIEQLRDMGYIKGRKTSTKRRDYDI